MDNSTISGFNHAQPHQQPYDAENEQRHEQLHEQLPMQQEPQVDNQTDEIKLNNNRIPLGMDSFNQQARDEFGQRVRLAMGLMQGTELPEKSSQRQSAMPTTAAAIANRLKTLGREVACTMADQLELLVRFDEQLGWQDSGARHCVAWIDLELGISRKLGWEYLRAGRALRTLPITRSLFRSGSLGWSKVRLISRSASSDTEALLCHAALDASVSELDRLCREYRWRDEQEENVTDTENVRALKQFEARSFTWNTASNGNTTIHLSLPPETARAFLNSVEQSLGQLEEPECTADSHVQQVIMKQRRADAAVLMAETSLQSAGREMATSDRYQVIVTVDAEKLGKESGSSSVQQKRATISGAGPIAQDTARRLACDCHISAISINAQGEPVNIGRKSRLWPPAMARAIKARDQHCQFPGCTITRHLQIHHIKHWADGGSTRVDNGVCLCSKHHSFVHEGGYRIERIDDQPQRLNDQFARQQANKDVHHQSFNDIERLLRNSRESFNVVRQVSPTRFRFRVVNNHGQNIRDLHVEQDHDTDQRHFYSVGNDSIDHKKSTRVEQHDSGAVKPIEDLNVMEESGDYYANLYWPSDFISSTKGIDNLTL